MASAVQTTELTLKQLNEKIEKMTAMLERSDKPSTPTVPMFAQFSQRDQRDGSWPVERLKRLSESYNHDAAALTMSRDPRRGMGWGPMLSKMGAIAEPRYGYHPGYTNEQLEREYGAVTLHKAASEGIKGLNGVVRKTALAEGSGVTGGYVVPPQWMNELLTIAAEQEFIRPRAKVVPMTSRTMSFPMLDVTSVQAVGTTPYYGGIIGTWQPEAQSINESEPQFKMTEWTAWDLELYCVSSNQLLADNGIGLDSLLTQLFSAAMPWYQEYAFLRGLGAGSSMPLGILNAPATLAQNRTTASHFKLPDAANMMAHLQVNSWDSACWIMHQSVLPELIQMHDFTGASNVGNRLVWLNPVMPGDSGPAANKLPKVFFNGLPVYWTEKLPQLGTKGDVMLVDWSRYIIADRMDLQIDVSSHYLFRNNQLAWRVISRLDGRPWLNSYITDQGGWQVSPFVCLN